MNRTSIAWTRNPDGSPGYTWNPLLGCKAISPGCLHCYAARLASTRLAHLPQYKGLAHDGKWTGEVRFMPERLAEPLEIKKPAGIFVNDMSDTFNESVTVDQIAEIWGTMAVAGASDGDEGSGHFGGTWNSKLGIWRPQSWKGPHHFYVLTKRARRMREVLSSRGFREKVASAAHRRAHDQRDAGYLSDCISGSNNPAAQGRAGRMWPLSNVLVGVTVENQAAADERIPELLQTPAAVRFLSVEPMLEAINLWRWLASGEIHQVIVGGESGTKARPFHVEWARSIRDQCKAAGVACFVKQMGSHFVDSNGMLIPIRDRAGADPSEWPADLRVQEVPILEEAKRGATAKAR